jgi:hypothetical protein
MKLAWPVTILLIGSSFLDRAEAATVFNPPLAVWGVTNSEMVANLPSDLGPVTAIAAGGQQSLALKADGTLVAWGDNDQSARWSYQGRSDCQRSFFQSGTQIHAGLSLLGV